MAKGKDYNPALIGLGSLLAIALISVVAFNVTPMPEPVPSDNVPLGFSAIAMLAIIFVAIGAKRKKDSR